jgi:hypothetical protein
MRILVTENQLRVIKEMAISTFHGTPHDFDKFTTTKVGTGESTQWFGWGLYFTDDESISDWYASSVAKARNEENINKIYRLYYKDNMFFEGKPINIARNSFWNFMYQFETLRGLPIDIIGSIYETFSNFISYKEEEVSGKKPNFPWFDEDKINNQINDRFKRVREDVKWTTRAYKDEKSGRWFIPQYDFDDKHILKLTKEWNDEKGENMTPKEYMERFWLVDKINRHWNILGSGDVPVDFNLLTDEKLIEYKQKLLDLVRSIQPNDIQLKKNDPLFKKTIKYHVTLHKGKTPDEYDYLSWYDEMTPEQKQKILSKLKEDGYSSEKFVMVTPADDDNLEAIKPKFFETVSSAKYYIQKQSYKVMLSGEGYMGSLKIVKTGFNMKKDLNGTVQDFYTKLCGLIGSDKKASMFLLSAGIDGIKYPNNTVSGGKTTGYNYVVFDENSVHIDRKEDRELKN